MQETLLTAEDVRAIADLARLELSEADVAAYQRQLSDILDYFQRAARTRYLAYRPDLVRLAADQRHARR